MALTLHVSPAGSDSSPGTEDAPFRTISRAAAVAMPGDTVLVHEGEYREWVDPSRGGLSDQRRITYQAADGERVVIKGSERITDWEHVERTVWTTEVPNALFGGVNPFAEPITGDWIVRPSPAEPQKHLGDVYLDGRSFYEVLSRDEVADPPLRSEVVDDWAGGTHTVLDPEQTQLVWYAEVGEDSTTIWANFQGADPTTELVEINVRRSVFYPSRHHVDYITVRGFELAQAATPWAPPTADQPGLIGPNWAKGWIIEDNFIHDAKCSAVSLGKGRSTGHNYSTERGDKPGYQYQLESVFSARQIGWDREHIGSHVVRRNTIVDCGQNGIVGHLGCVFSTIEDNHIARIGIKREYYGFEIAGIKLHAPIDVTIRGNHIHDCTLGTWLDWQAQGTRVSRNVFHRNTRDLFIEVSHGPCVVDHNVLGSPISIELFSQGNAFVNNLVLGTLMREQVLDRPTPYHQAHSTQVAGYAAILGGDDRWIANLFIPGGPVAAAYGPGAHPAGGAGHGTADYDGHPASFEEYLAQVDDPSLVDHDRYRHVKQPVYIRGNVYCAGAEPFEAEEEATVLPTAASAAVVVDGDAVYLDIELPRGFDDALSGVTAGRDLPGVRLVDADFEEHDGSPVLIDIDLAGTQKRPGDRYVAGALAGLRSGSSRMRLL